jgi:hypothetical protein
VKKAKVGQRANASHTQESSNEERTAEPSQDLEAASNRKSANCSVKSRWNWPCEVNCCGILEWDEKHTQSRESGHTRAHRTRKRDRGTGQGKWKPEVNFCVWSTSQVCAKN